MNIHTPILRGIRTISSTLGIVSSVGVVVCLLLILVTFVRTSSIEDNPSHRLTARSISQQHATSTLTKDTLRLQIAVSSEDWDSIDPLFDSLVHDADLWIQSHESNQQNQIGNIARSSSSESVSDLYDRVNYPMNAMKRALDDIEKVTRSIIRRAPYIDQHSQALLTAAVNELIELEPEYQEILGLIADLYSDDAQSQMTTLTNKAQQSQMILLSAFMCLIALGFAPKLAGQSKRIVDLDLALESSAQKSDERWSWLASLGQAIQSPMSRINGSADDVLRDDIDEETRSQQREAIIGESARVMTLLEDVRELAELESGSMEFASEQVDPRETLQAIESVFQRHALASGIEFKINIEESCPSSITTDPARLKQILSEVVENAIHYTAKGSVEVHASLEEMDQQSLMTFRVVDTGAGIDAAEISKVFEPFAHAGNSDMQGGAGIGLAKARSLARKLGGDICIESAKGAGCYVTITIDAGDFELRENHSASEKTELPESASAVDSTDEESTKRAA